MSRYYEITTPEGKTERYVSVTTALQALPRPPSLVEWMDKTPDASRHMRDRATIGTITHWRINRYLSKKHGLPIQPLSLDCTIITQEIKDAVDVIWSYFTDAMEKVELTPFYLEKQIVNHKYKYAGTMDYAGLVDGKKAILDFKTFKDLYGDHTVGAQLAAYKRGTDYKAEELYVLILNEQTGWDLVPVSDDWEKFLEALTLHNSRQEKPAERQTKIGDA